jgi:HK97 family phage major capsid protein
MTRKSEYRAETVKSLLEQRNDKITEMEGVINAAKAETRAMNDDEQKKFEGLEADIAAIDKTIEAEERARNIPERKPEEKTETEQRAETDFDAFLRGNIGALPRGLRVAEPRADAQSTVLNENIIPEEFSRDIIRKVTELSGVFSSITKVKLYGLAFIS